MAQDHDFPTFGGKERNPLPTRAAERHAVGVDRTPSHELPLIILDHDVGARRQLFELELDRGVGLGHHSPDEADPTEVTPAHTRWPPAGAADRYAATTSGAGPSIMCSFREAKRI